jgi:hypothetical protein
VVEEWVEEAPMLQEVLGVAETVVRVDLHSVLQEAVDHSSPVDSVELHGSPAVTRDKLALLGRVVLVEAILVIISVPAAAAAADGTAVAVAEATAFLADPSAAAAAAADQVFLQSAALVTPV